MSRGSPVPVSHRDRIYGVAGLCLDETSVRMLMTLRAKDKPRGGMWQHPGGRIEPIESAEQALVREWKEELGVVARVVGPRLSVGILSIESIFEIWLYPVVIDQGTPQPLDADDLGWFSLHEAVVNLACTPVTYQFHDAIRAYMLDRAFDRVLQGGGR